MADDQDLGAEAFLRWGAWSVRSIGLCAINKRPWAELDAAPCLDKYFAHVGMNMDLSWALLFDVTVLPWILLHVGAAFHGVDETEPLSRILVRRGQSRGGVV